MRKIGVTGHNGRLGTELVRLGCIPVVCDVQDRKSVVSGVEKFMELADDSSCIIHCAAITDVDYCETPQGELECYKVNHVGTSHLRDVYSGQIIYISTDYVFDGLHGPYSEKQYPEPIGNYGDSKYLGETVLFTERRDSVPGDKIIRTTVLYGSPIKTDFVRNILDQLVCGEPIKVTTSLIGSPTNVEHLAEALLYFCNMDMKKVPDIVNIVGTDVISRYEFALMIAGVFGMDKSLILPVTRYESLAFRPKKAGLKVHLARRLGIPLHDVMDGLITMKRRLDGA